MTMYTPRIVSLFCLLLLIAVARCSAQVEMTGTVGEASPSFFVDAISFASTDSLQSRLDVFIQVGYDNLSFVKRDGMYEAAYELTTTVSDVQNSVVTEKTSTEEVKGLTFDQSVAPGAFKVTQLSLLLKPGEYSIAVQLRDNESNSARRVQRRLLVPDYVHAPMALSDIMLVAKLVVQGGKTTLLPSISSNVGTIPDSFFVFLEAYNRSAIDTAKFLAQVVDDKGHVLLRTDTLRALHPGRNEVIMRIEHSRLPIGDFRLFVFAMAPSTPSDDPEKNYASTNRAISVRWRGLPQGVKSLDAAIDQLRYIAKDKELSYIKDGPTLEEKQRRFLEFWKKRDPNPNTPRNEKMEAYYARVEYANKHFSHYIEGWRTDMGMVYITFGPPSNVERHPFEVDSKPYEIWSYYEINHSFVFVDETGFGDYRLTTPMWETWQRPRD